MKSTIQPYSKSEISEALRIAYGQVDEQISPLELPVFHRQPIQRWSIANQVEHLIISSKGVASALKMPKEQLAKFGIPEAPSRDYDTLSKDYYAILNQGMKAPPQFDPNVEENTGVDQLLGNWKMIGDKFEKRISEWDDKDLDNYLLPHPALGLLTIREMLLFTILHTKHHLKAIQELIKEANVN